jgi:hypothetical protein
MAMVVIGRHQYMKPANQEKQAWGNSKGIKWKPGSGGRGADRDKRNW